MLRPSARLLILFLTPLMCQSSTLTLTKDHPLILTDTVLDTREQTFDIRVSSPLGLRVETKVEDLGQILLVLQTRDLLHHWRVGEEGNISISRPHIETLCRGGNETDTMKLRVTTRSPTPLQFSVTLSLVVDMELLPGQTPALTTISPTRQELFQFRFPLGLGDHLLKVKKVPSHLPAVCTLVSVQPLESCPGQLYLSESNMRFGEKTVYQTMLETSAIVLSPAAYPEGVNIVLRAKMTDRECYVKTSPEGGISDREMEVQVSVERLEEDLVLSTILVLVGYLLVGLLGVAVSLFSYKRFGFEFEGKLKKAEVRLEHKLMESQSPTSDLVDGEARGDQAVFSNIRLVEKPPLKMFWQEELAVSQDETDSGETTAGRVIRTRLTSETTRQEVPYLSQVVTLDLVEVSRRRADRENVTVADMTVHFDPELFPNHQTLRSELYLWLVLLVGVFYTLPVVQLVYYHQETSVKSGNLDLCYYNYLCLYPWGNLADFGHVFSNVGYIISGLFFILIVTMRRFKYKKLLNNPNLDPTDSVHPRYTGIPESFGIFYALGGALTMEGILSGCYHVCPTAENFQFDTTFMYAISTLMFLKVYQFRHYDITFSAYFVFAVLGFVLIFEVIGIFTSNILFWIVFVTIYIIFVIVFIVQVYYNQSGPSMRDRLLNMFSGIRNIVRDRDFHSQELNKDMLLKFIPTFVILFVNIGMGIFFAFKRKPGVSRYLLAILMVNMTLYVLYYLGAKVYYRCRTKDWRKAEGLRKVTILYGLASLSFMAGAVVFFIRELKTSAGSPAESRNLNDDCFLLIFDNHDMWHFLSAAGLFYLFMFILTLEDYNMAESRKKIPVF